MSIMAFAAIAMTMTSCNKDEAISTDLNLTYEESEVMNDVKMHFVGDDQYWDNNDRIYVIDGNNNYAWYRVSPGSAPVFERVMRGDFNVNEDPLTAIYPYNIYMSRTSVKLAPRQYSIGGNISTSFPMYANGSVSNLPWANLCGVLRLYVKGDAISIDSVSVTADSYLNGVFNVNMNNTYPLSYKANGTKTNTVRFNNPIVTNLTDPQVINIYLPAGDYNSLNITFYSGNQKLVKRNNASVNISKSQYNNRNFTLNIDDFETFTKGAIDVVYNVGTGNVIFSKGNLEYVCAADQYMNFAENQWDFRGTSQDNIQTKQDRDLFAWGANGYYVSGRMKGNNIPVWATLVNRHRNYAYSTATSLLNNDEWGSNKIANGGNVANNGWRTLTATEMEYLLDNYNNAMVTLSFVGKQGLLIFPTGVTPVADGTSLTKSQWNALDAAGCIFFVADNYRTATPSMANTGSYFWLNTAAENTASALVVDKTAGASIVPNADKKIGGFVRLVKDVE